MGLFSGKPKTVSNSIREAVHNNDKNFSYTTKSGFTHTNLPLETDILYEKNGFWNYDDFFEMYAPRMVSLFENINNNVNKLLVQNQLLEERVKILEKKLEDNSRKER